MYGNILITWKLLQTCAIKVIVRVKELVEKENEENYYLWPTHPIRHDVLWAPLFYFKPPSHKTLGGPSPPTLKHDSSLCHFSVYVERFLTRAPTIFKRKNIRL